MTGTSHKGGFVLPSVLAYIAAFTFIVVLAAGSLDRARAATVDLTTQRELQSALDDIEAQALYAWLTSTPVERGVELFKAPVFDASAVVLGSAAPGLGDAQPGAPAHIWLADGGMIVLASGRFQGRVIYRDAAGLVSLNSSDVSVVQTLLQAWGVDSEKAANLAAALKDYVDDDSLRRPRGGEAADYRLRQRPPPSNSPLRDIAEVSAVLGWDELGFLGTLDFIQQVTISLAAPEPRWIFADEPVRRLQQALPPGGLEAIDPIAMASNAHSVPGARARLTLAVFEPGTERGRIRIIEVERQSTALAAPFARVLVYEAGYARSADDALSTDLQPLDLFDTGNDE